MKKIIVLVLLMFSLSSIYSFDIKFVSQKVVFAKDTLQNKGSLESANLIEKQQLINDTIIQNSSTQEDGLNKGNLERVDLLDEVQLNNKPIENSRAVNSFQNKITPEMNNALKELHSAFDRIKVEIDIIQSNLDFQTILAAKDRSREEIEVKIRADISNEIASLEKKLEEKQNTINLLQEEKSKQKIQLDSLNSKMISLNYELASSKTECEKSYNVKIEEGKKIVYDKILGYYQMNTLDYLIKNSTPASLNQDLLLIGNNAVVNQSIHNLQTYYSVKKILDEKYNEQNVKDGLYRIGGVIDSELVSELNTKLGEYKGCYIGLKELINKLNEEDNNLQPLLEEAQSEKWKNITSQITLFYYNRNFTDYSYLADIVSELMEIKRKDVNGDIKHLIDKL